MNFDDRAEANTSAEQYKDQEQNKFQRDNKDKQGMPGPNMSLAYRDDEIERQNFSNEATLRWVFMQTVQLMMMQCVTHVTAIYHVSLQHASVSQGRQGVMLLLLLFCVWLCQRVSFWYWPKCIEGVQSATSDVQLSHK